MKNIHVLPTDKPSNITIRKRTGELVYDAEPFTHDEYDVISNQHIYITNNSDIKEGDWCLSKLNEVVRFGKKFTASLYKKIILTTDQDLIKDGVQSIDDEFLEWFVKNPSCERVEVEKYHGINTSISEVNYIAGDGSLSWQGKNDLRDYKIIIPKEEPNPLTVGKEFYESADKNITVYRQETLEEAAERYAESKSSNFSFRNTHIRDFKEGAKWQQERMYSEEDLLSAFEAGMMFIGEDKGSFREWFEKFKKK
jgi:hypothetical protein